LSTSRGPPPSSRSVIKPSTPPQKAPNLSPTARASHTNPAKNPAAAEQAAIYAEQKAKALDNKLKRAQVASGKGGSKRNVDETREELRQLTEQKEEADRDAEAKREAARRHLKQKESEDRIRERAEAAAELRHAQHLRQQAEGQSRPPQRSFFRPIFPEEERISEAHPDAPVYQPTLPERWYPRAPVDPHIDPNVQLPLLKHRELPGGAWAKLRRDGFVILRGLLSHSEVKVLRAQVHRSHSMYETHAENQRQEEDSIAERPAQANTKVFNLWKLDPASQLLVTSGRLAGTAADLLGASPLRLYHDHTRFKRPGDHATEWHADLTAAPFASERLITAYVALVDVSSRMGPPEFAARSHRGAVSGYNLDDEQVQENYRIEGSEGLKAGDIVFYLGWTIHRDGPNLASWTQEAYIVSFIGDGVPVIELEDFNPERMSSEDKDSYVGWLHEVEPGQPAAHPLLPTVWPPQDRAQDHHEDTSSQEVSSSAEQEHKGLDASSRQPQPSLVVPSYPPASSNRFRSSPEGEQPQGAAPRSRAADSAGEMSQPFRHERCTKLEQGLTVICDTLGQDSEECVKLKRRKESECM